MTGKGELSSAGRLEPHPTCVADRYDVIDKLGRGGMASAYRVRDRSSGQELALKRLDAPGRDGTVVELFEREFHTLTQLSHARIVRAHDYGFDDDHPFYTMELLDGGDVRQLAPLPWPEVCAIAYDVCSALALLHSRRLVHRDLTPRNVRRTTDGAAKLLDFGLLEAFGPCSVIAGTPPYVAPELVNRISLDGRSDLFSLGGTLYFALTGKVAFPVNRFDQLRDVWRSIPVSPRSLVPEIPEALDQLVMALLRIDIGSRPRSAAEVMDRIAPLLPCAPDVSLSAAAACLSAPMEVARQDMRTRMRKQVVRTVRGRGGGFLIAGESGTGRSRAIDSFILEAKLMGAVVARAGADEGASGPFGAARALVTQLHQGAEKVSFAVAERDPGIRSVLFGDAPGPTPPLLDVSRPGLARADVQAALRDWVVGLLRHRPLALALDDFDLVDEPSAALFAALSLDASRRRLTYAASVRRNSLERASAALAVLRDNALSVMLEPLHREQMRTLLASVFGDVPNLDGVTGQLHELSGGRPRECMLLAQHLVDTGVITHVGGAFRLPATIDSQALPTGFEGAWAAQVNALSDSATRVGRLLALSATGHLSRAQLLSIAELGSARVDAAVEALRSVQALVGATRGYRIGHPSIPRLLLADVPEAELCGLHDRLAELHQREGFGALAIAYHSLRGSDPGQALSELLAQSVTAEERTLLVEQAVVEIGADRTDETYRLAFEVASTLKRSKRDLFCLFPTLAGLSATGSDVALYDLVAADWLCELKRASGYLDWVELPLDLEPATRAIQAFVKASERHQALPEGEWAPAPADAIKEMVAYVVFTIAVASRTRRLELVQSLPALLEPFMSFSAVVHAMQLNAQVACALSEGRREQGRQRYLELLAVIDAIDGEPLPFMHKVRAAVCQAIASQDAALGIRAEDPEQWLRSDDPNQRVGAEYIRKIMALHRGDWKAAEEHRRQAELIGLQNDTKAMFSTLIEELEVHALARDLTGLGNVRERIHENARRYPDWRIVSDMADGYHHYLRGEGQAAFERLSRLREAEVATKRLPGYRMIWLVEGVMVEILLERGETDAALRLGREALATCDARGLRHDGRSVSLALALAEARAGEHAAARARVLGVIAAQRELGVAGLLLGRSHEYLARCAIEAGDREAFESASAAAAEQYRPGFSEVLGALHERLLEDARRAGLIEGGTKRALDAVADELTEIATRVETTLLGCRGARQRVDAALSLLCDAADAEVAHLYLLTRKGLLLSASTTGLEPSVAERLLAYAQAQVELEQDDDVCTMTEGLVADVSNGSLTVVRDGHGRTLYPIPLVSRTTEAFLLVGILLIDRRRADPKAAATIAAVGKHLIDSGRYRPVAVA